MTTDEIIRDGTCPTWCVAVHGAFDGEEDHVHMGSDLHLVEGVTARLCSSFDPDTGSADGPHIIVGSAEWTVVRTRDVALALLALADAASQAASDERDRRID